MRAARLHAAHDVRIEEVPTPSPGPGEVLVRVRAVAICPSDWRLWDAGDAGGAPLQAPIIQGHEFAGEVAKLGEGVEGFCVGDRVAVEPSWHCGQCDQCAKGRFNICRNVRFPSFPPENGALAEFIACPAVNVCKLPEGLDFTGGALAEPVGVALHAVRLAGLHPQERVAVLGGGVIGLTVLQLALREGCQKVTVVEPVAGRRELIERFSGGRAQVCDSATTLAAEDFEADVVFECAGFSGAVAQALPLASPGGRVVVVGIPHPERVEFEANVPRRRELTIVFVRRSRNTLEEALQLIASGALHVRDIPVRRFPLERTEEAIVLTGERPGDVLRAVVEP